MHNMDSELDAFVKSLKTGRHPMTDEYEGLRTVAFAEAALESARLGRPVRLPAMG